VDSNTKKKCRRTPASTATVVLPAKKKSSQEVVNAAFIVALAIFPVLRHKLLDHPAVARIKKLL